jgi:hypothetical protein
MVQRWEVGVIVGVEPEGLLAAAGAAAGAAATVDGVGELAELVGAADAGTEEVAGAYGDVAGDWPVRRARLAEDLRMLSAFATAATEAMTALDGQLVTVDVPR